MAIEPIKGFYVHDEATNTDGVAEYGYQYLLGAPDANYSIDLTNNVSSGTITTNVDIGSVVSTNVDTNSGWKNLVVPCKKGDKFTITGGGGNGARLWALTNSNFVLYEKAETNTIVEDAQIFSAKDGYAIFNLQIASHIPTPSVLLSSALSVVEIKSAISKDNEIDLSDDLSYGTITTAVNAGAVVDPSVNTNVNWWCICKPCKKGDVFEIKGMGGNGARLWALTDSNYTLYAKAEAGDGHRTNAISIVAGTDGFFIYNTQTRSDFTSPYIIHKTKISSWQSTPSPKPYYIYKNIPTMHYDAIGDESFQLFSWDVNYTIYDDVVNAYDELVTDYPGVTKTTLGKDQTNTYNIYRYELDVGTVTSNREQTQKKPVIVITAGIHGYEKASVFGTFYFVRELLKHWAEDETLAYIRHSVKLVIVPVANPWGFMHDTYCNGNTSVNADGVNINRNFEYGWNSSLTGEQYAGTAPYSEKETQYIKAILDEYIDNLFYIDFHTTGAYSVVPERNTFSIWAHDNAITNKRLYWTGKEFVENVNCRLYNKYGLTYAEGTLLTNYNVHPDEGRAGDYMSNLGGNSFTLEMTPRFVNDTRSHSNNIGKFACELLGNLITTACRNFAD